MTMKKVSFANTIEIKYYNFKRDEKLLKKLHNIKLNELVAKNRFELKNDAFYSNKRKRNKYFAKMHVMNKLSILNYKKTKKSICNIF